jgi:hypothetical protein
MNKLAKQLNETLGPAASFLSREGKRMYFPYVGILGQGAEAKKCEINATIGMAFEEDGSPLVMDCFRFIAEFAGEVPGASAKDCGNYLDMNLPMANYWGRKYAALLEHADDSRLIYPE